MAAAVLALPAAASAQGAPAPAAPTFTKDIAPILQRSCQTCHREGEIAPMAFTTYAEVRPWARSIKNRVVARDMPPFHVDRTIGIQTFKDDPSLSDAEIADDRPVGGRRRARRATRPTCRRPAASPRPATGRSARPISSSSSRPTPCPPPAGPVRRAVRGHSDRRGSLHPGDPDALGDAASRTRSCTTPCPTRWQTPTRATQRGMDEGQFLVEYASGKNAEVYPEGPACCSRRASSARLSYHLHSIGEETKAEVELGIVLYPKGYVPKHIRWSRQLAQPTTPLDIPAGTVARSDGYTILHKPARLIAFQPHMHNLGKRQCLEVDLSDVGHANDHRDAQLRRTSTTTGTSPTTTPMMCSRWCRPARSCTTSSGTTTSAPIRARSIRRTGSATASGRSTRWASSGSAGSS